jgi:hypothetical protein
MTRRAFAVMAVPDDGWTPQGPVVFEIEVAKLR